MKRSRLWSWRRTGIKCQIHNSGVIGAWGAVSVKWRSNSLSLKERGSMGWGLEITSVDRSFQKGHQWTFLNPCFYLSLDSIVLWLPLSVNVFSHDIYIMSSDAISMFPLLVVYTKDLEGWTVVMPDTLGHRKTGRRAFQREGTWAKAWGGTRRTNTWVSDS